MSESLEDRVVVVSPHLDDAAISLGAAIAFAARHGAVLTIFAGDPESEAPAGGWDKRGGFGTEGDAARARREEDSMAFALLGAGVTWLPFGDEQYDRHRSQVGLLNLSPGVGSRLDRMLWREFVHGGEAVAWLKGRTA